MDQIKQKEFKFQI